MITQARLKELLDYDPETGLFTWKIDKNYNAKRGQVAGSFWSQGYRGICLDRKLYSCHRLAFIYMLGMWPKEIDYIDRNKANNQWKNLRVATRSQNNCNAPIRIDNTSGFKGVSFRKHSRRWSAKITISKNGKQSIQQLGCFSTPEEAAEAYNEAAKIKYGEFAYLNDTTKQLVKGNKRTV